MALPEERARYRLRRQTVEPVFGIVKRAMGFRQFLLRGLESVVLAVCAALGADAGATEGDTMEFTVKLGAALNGWAVRYKYKTQDGAAVKGEDYEETTGTVTFNSGVKEQKVYVDTIDDSEEEDPEVFKLKLYDQEVNGRNAREIETRAPAGESASRWISPTNSPAGTFLHNPLINDAHIELVVPLR